MAKIQLISETRALDRRKPGFALLKISGWKHSPEQTQMSIQSSEDEKFLGTDGQWEPTPVWQSLSNMNLVSDNVLEGDVGPALVDPIVNSPNNSYRVTLKSDSESDVRTMRVDSNVLASSASGSAPDSLAFGNGFILDDSDAGLPGIEAPETLDISDSEIEIDAENKPVEDVRDTVVQVVSTEPGFFSRYKTILIIMLVLIFLALLGGAAWHFKWLSGSVPQSDPVEPKPVEPKPVEPKPVEPKPVPAPAPTPTPTPTPLNDMELLRQFLATKPSTDDILAKAKEWNNGHCKAMLKMMVYSGHKSDDYRIAFEYAKMHDPNLFKAGGCIEKSDKDTAIYWYQKSIDMGNADAKNYLEKL